MSESERKPPWSERAHDKATRESVKHEALVRHRAEQIAKERGSPWVEPEHVTAAVAACEGRGIRFRKGSDLKFATADEDGEVFAGDQFLVCVELCTGDKKKTWNEWVVVTCTETGWDVYGESWDLDWTCVEWFVPVKELNLLLRKAVAQ